MIGYPANNRLYRTTKNGEKMFEKTERYRMYENMRKAKAQKRQDADAPSYPAILPQKRRVITIVD